MWTHCADNILWIVASCFADSSGHHDTCVSTNSVLSLSVPSVGFWSHGGFTSTAPYVIPFGFTFVFTFVFVESIIVFVDGFDTTYFLYSAVNFLIGGGCP